MWSKAFMCLDEDPQVDESITLVCLNNECGDYGVEWHPHTFTEYQGEHPMGGTVELYEDEAFLCSACLKEGEEM